eukprot:6552012-Pyramimonas_sp.AAC.1
MRPRPHLVHGADVGGVVARAVVLAEEAEVEVGGDALDSLQAHLQASGFRANNKRKIVYPPMSPR